MTFPSSDNPALPTLTIDVPDGWGHTVAPGTLLAAVKSVPPGQFAVNIVVSVTRFGSDHALSTSIEALHTRLAANGEAAWGAETSSDAHAAAGYAGEVSVRDGRVGTLVQGHRMILLDRGPVRDLVHAVGSCTAEQTTSELPILRAALDSLKIEA